MIFLALPHEPHCVCDHVLCNKEGEASGIIHLQCACTVCMNMMSTYQLFKIHQVVVKSLVAFMNERNV